MGASTAGAIGGQGAMGVGGMFAARRTNSNSKRALNKGNLGSDLLQMENLFLPYDQLVEMGRINPGQRGFEGLYGQQSRVGRDLGGFESMLAASDPVFAQYQKTMQGGLAGLESGGLPSDFKRTLLEDVRTSQASRGLVDSDTSAIEEAARLMGGSEQIRSSRLAEAQNYLSGVTQSALSYLLPNMSAIYGGELQRALQGSQNAIGAANVGAQIAS